MSMFSVLGQSLSDMPKHCLFLLHNCYMYLFICRDNSFVLSLQANASCLGTGMALSFL